MRFFEVFLTQEAVEECKQMDSCLNQALEEGTLSEPLHGHGETYKSFSLASKGGHLSKL